jgi:hypothetical protein
MMAAMGVVAVAGFRGPMLRAVGLDPPRATTVVVRPSEPGTDPPATEPTPPPPEPAPPPPEPALTPTEPAPTAQAAVDPVATTTASVKTMQSAAPAPAPKPAPALTTQFVPPKRVVPAYRVYRPPPPAPPPREDLPVRSNPFAERK